MAKPKHSSGEGFVPARTIAWIRLLLLAAAAIASYLLSVSLSGGGVAGCGPQSGCHSVLNSRWAYWFGLPVSLPALVLYLGMIGATFWLRPANPAPVRRKSWIFLLSGAWAILAAALWFLILQAAVLHTFCPYCLTAHALAAVAALLLLRNAPFRPAPEKMRDRERQVFLAPSLRVKFLAAGLGMAIGLVAGQTLYVRPGYKIGGVAPSVLNRKGPERTLEIYGGKFKMNLEEVPLLGSPTASNVMLSLFDYTCHHCRAMHPLLVSAQQYFSNGLAIVNLPMPLDGRCNPIFRGKTPRDHREACDYARLGLAIWRANPARMAEFDNWVFQTTVPRLYTSARGFAQELLGPQVLAKALDDPWVQQQLTNDIAIYTAAYESGNSQMPQLLIGTNLTSGDVSMDKLLNLLDTHFHLRAGGP